jgi:hypothetical protein
MINPIIKPVPLSADSQRAALTNLDKNIGDQIASLAEKIKTILPDEIAILAKANKLKPEDQQALVAALRAVDPTGVYESWVKGNPQDTAGAELAARHTDIKRLMARLSQDAEKDKADLKQDVAEFDAAVGKVATATPAVADLTAPVKTLKTWVEARKLIESASPGKGPVAKLPAGGDVTLIFDPGLPQGTAIVLGEQAMVIGNEGRGSLTISKGNAAEALGLPIVTGKPLDALEGEEVAGGVLLINPANSKGTINYNINGDHYVAQPGMKQKLAALPNGRPWNIEYDRGETFGRAVYKLFPGTYFFTPTELGWQLYKQRYELVIDNTKSNQEFNLIFQEEDVTVPAGSSRTLSSNYPIVVRFDRGNGEEFVTKSTPLATGNLEVGVNPTDNMWDLFPTTDNHREAANLKPFNLDGAGKGK